MHRALADPPLHPATRRKGKDPVCQGPLKTQPIQESWLMAMTAFIGILMPVSTLSRVSSQQDLTEILLLHTTTTNYVGCCEQVMLCTYLVSMFSVLRKYEQHIQKHYEQLDHRKTNVYGGGPSNWYTSSRFRETLPE